MTWWIYFPVLIVMFTGMDYIDGPPIKWGSNFLLASILTAMFFLGEKIGEFIIKRMELKRDQG